MKSWLSWFFQRFLSALPSCSSVSFTLISPLCRYLGSGGNEPQTSALSEWSSRESRRSEGILHVLCANGSLMSLAGLLQWLLSATDHHSSVRPAYHSPEFLPWLSLGLLLWSEFYSGFSAAPAHLLFLYPKDLSPPPWTHSAFCLCVIAASSQKDLSFFVSPHCQHIDTEMRWNHLSGSRTFYDN